MADLWAVERERFAAGADIICGVDEAGAGPLAGPVCAAAVVLPPFIEIPGLNDSKKLTPKKRGELYDIIAQRALVWCVSMVDEKTIDEINILNARMLAMERAINGLAVRPSLALIDGNRSAGITCPCMTVVGGDGLSASIAAASVMAKVTRDRFMLQLAAEYPQYGFEKHKGYGTKLHYEKIFQYGPSPVHRRSFLKNLEEHR